MKKSIIRVIGIEVLVLAVIAFVLILIFYVKKDVASPLRINNKKNVYEGNREYDGLQKNNSNSKQADEEARQPYDSLDSNELIKEREFDIVPDLIFDKDGDVWRFTMMLCCKLKKRKRS